MAQYSAYSVVVTNGSPTVISMGATKFTSKVEVGQAFKITGDLVIYQIAAIVSDTQLTLSAPYAGSTKSNATYQITTDYTPNFHLAEVNVGDHDWPINLTVQTIRQIDTIMGGFASGYNIKGEWNANLNIPAIPVAAESNQGWIYRVSVAGASSINGINTWYEGDSLISNGSVWFRVPSIEVSINTAATSALENATSALESATSALLSKNAAAVSETNAGVSKNAAAVSAADAAAAATSLQSALVAFGQTFLGRFASDPTTDNQGNQILDGATYINTVSDTIRIYSIETHAWSNYDEAAQAAAQAASLSATNASASATYALASQQAAATSESHAATYASSALSSADSAATSAASAASLESEFLSAVSSASASKTAAALSEVAASTSASAAATSATNAATSASAAATSATNASTSASAAATSATNASTSAANAANSSTSSANSALAASTSATNAAASKTAASTSATNAAASASAANAAEVAATTSATSAGSYSTIASNAATTSVTKANEAATSAAAASTSATNASNSAAAASTSATNASTSATAAVNASTDVASKLILFNHLFLGEKTADPAVDNNGNALAVGTLYYYADALQPDNNAMKVYNGTAWVVAYATLQGTLVAGNNLSDVTNPTSARTNIGAASMTDVIAIAIALG